MGARFPGRPNRFAPIPYGAETWSPNFAAVRAGRCGWCWTCNAHYASGFHPCIVCFNKRCPHATDCELPCTRSNEYGQSGSVYS